MIYEVGPLQIDLSTRTLLRPDKLRGPALTQSELSVLNSCLIN